MLIHFSKYCQTCRFVNIKNTVCSVGLQYCWLPGDALIDC